MTNQFEYEQLLKCLAMQKSIQPDASGIYVGKDDVRQAYIDSVYQKGMELLRAMQENAEIKQTKSLDRTCYECGSAILLPSNEERLTDKERQAIEQLRDRIASFISSQVVSFWPEHMSIHLDWNFRLGSYDIDEYRKSVEKRESMTNNCVIVCVGVPASGKTVWALEYCKNNPNTIRVNKDSLRLMAYGEPYRPEWEDFICALRDRVIDQSLYMGYDVVVDDTNGNQKHRKRIELIANFYDATIAIKDFRDVPLEVCLERNKNRPNSVPEEAIHRIYDQIKEQEL